MFVVKTWAVVVTQLFGRSLPKPEIGSSDPVIGKFNLISNVLKKRPK